MPFQKGMVHVYTGNGKGKTTAAIGLAIRAAGNGLNVLFVSFMKGPSYPYGEEVIFEKIPNITHRKFGTDYFVSPGTNDELAISEAKAALKFAAERMMTGEYDLVILDEVNVAVNFGLISAEEVLRVLRERPEGVEVVLTGRYAPQEFIDFADLVTEMREVKHYFREGVPARKGIEF